MIGIVKRLPPAVLFRALIFRMILIWRPVTAFAIAARQPFPFGKIFPGQAHLSTATSLGTAFERSY